MALKLVLYLKLFYCKAVLLSTMKWKKPFIRYKISKINIVLLLILKHIDTGRTKVLYTWKIKFKILKNSLKSEFGSK